MSDTLYETIPYRGCTIEQHTDADASNPRKEFDNVGTMVCWSSRYVLGDEQPKDEPEEFLKTIASKEYWREGERLDARLDAVQVRFGYRQPYYLAKEAAEQRLAKLLEADLTANLLMLPLYLYDHSGITISTGPFTCRWDSGRVGFIYCTLEQAQHEWGTEDSKARGWDGEASYTKKEDGTPRTLREAATSYLEGEVETYDNYLTGEVYGYVAKDWEGKEIGSCWGYYGDDGSKADGYMVDEAKAAIDSYIEYCAETMEQSGEH